jgi:hypothetical protein
MGFSMVAPAYEPWEIERDLRPSKEVGKYATFSRPRCNAAVHPEKANTSGRNLKKDANGNYIGESAPFDPVTRANKILREDNKGYHLKRVKMRGVVAVKAHSNRNGDIIVPNEVDAPASTLAVNLMRLPDKDQPVALRDLKRRNPTMYALVKDKMQTA